MTGQENNSNGNDVQTPGGVSTPAKTLKNPVQPSLAMIPFTPVPFVGRGAPWAWLRLGVYSGLGAMTWKHNKQLSYLLMGAAGVSLMTSMFQAAWNGTPAGGES